MLINDKGAQTMELRAEWEKSGAAYWVKLVQVEPNGGRHEVTRWMKFASLRGVEGFAREYNADLHKVEG